MNLDVLGALRTAAGRRLIATGRALSRAGARLLRHPAGRSRHLRLVEHAGSASAQHANTDALAVVRSARAFPYRYQPEDTA